MSNNNISKLLLLGLATCSALPVLSLSHSSPKIIWAPCGNTTIPRECGTFEVPLDYKNSGAGKALLAVARINATKTPRLGTLFTNPGGPGWDPRGIGSTIPKVECFQSGTEETTFWNGSIRGNLLELRGNFSDATERQWFYSRVNETDKALIRFGKQCNKESQYMLKYIGTPANVRDMVALHDYLEGDKPINYWGVSYGTILGSFFVNMFPKRVGRVIIDGVVDPWLWATRPFLEIGHVSLNSTDAVFDAFALNCANAGPSKCAIAQDGSTVDSIRKWTFDLIAAAYDNSKVNGGAIITAGQLRAVLWLGMYHPREWPAFAQNLAQISVALGNSTFTANTTFIRRRTLENIQLLNARGNAVNASDPPSDYAYQAITCADAVDPGKTTTRDGFEAVVNITQHVSSMFGPHMVWFSGEMYCHHWPSRAVERFTGPFNHKLANKILVIGNLADPITPYISAKRVADALGDSAVLIKHLGYGHTSLVMNSNCTVAATVKYFTKGEAPSSNLVCETDEKLFS
ncbi:hypothetical protein BDV93DRAFT_609757 [Ceratobasidium sp. AG-I]|nr:hypothetical protein BDV93DRAFT_609757 [Ceratobasidium sp. AG-I]